KARSADDDQRYLTDAQVRALIDGMPERYQTLVQVMARVGLRPGEAYALTVGQFDAERRTLRIDRTVDSPTTKTGESRTVHLPTTVAEAIEAHIRKFSDETDRPALIFPNGNGKMLDRNSFRHL